MGFGLRQHGWARMTAVVSLAGAFGCTGEDDIAAGVLDSGRIHGADARAPGMGGVRNTGGAPIGTGGSTGGVGGGRPAFDSGTPDAHTPSMDASHDTSVPTRDSAPNDDVSSKDAADAHRDVVIDGGARDGGGPSGLRCRKVLDLNPGLAWSSPEQLTVAGNQIFFHATTDTLGKELWVTDGTASGTHLVKDIRTGTKPALFGSMAVLNGIVYFMAIDDTHGGELWRSDGTGSGTYIVRDIVAGPAEGRPQSLKTAGGFVYFDGVVQSSTRALYRTDGTDAGTIELVQPRPGFDPLFSSFIEFGSRLCFLADTSAAGSHLWCSDGTPSGTGMPFTTSTRGINQLAVYKGDLYFASVSTNGEELFRWDGVASSPTLVKRIGAGGYFDRLYNLTAAGDKLYFSVQPGDGTGREPWVSDGTDTGTHMLADLYAANESSGPADFTTLAGSTVVFMANLLGLYGAEPWVTDGTVAGTRLLKDIATTTEPSEPHFFSAINGSLLFAATDTTVGRELYMTDGTVAGTVLAGDLEYGPAWSFPEWSARLGDAVYFAANDGRFGRELWKCAVDGGPSDTERFDPLAPCPGTSGPAMVRLGVYCIDSTEVTNGQYKQFLDSSPDAAQQRIDCAWNQTFVPACPSFDPAGAANFPVACVDWCDAAQYCKWAGKHLCTQVGGTGVLTSNVIDWTLWQAYAACSEEGQRVYPYGQSYAAGLCVDDFFDGTSGNPSSTDVAHPVGQQCEGAHGGIFDLVGNVAEWQDDGKVATATGGAPTHGGSFVDYRPTCMSYNDLRSFVRNTTSSSIGFRCCAE